MICDNITVKDGVLHFAGQNTVELAKKYGTPLYLMDEDKVRENAERTSTLSKSISDLKRSRCLHPRQTASSAFMKS